MMLNLIVIHEFPFNPSLLLLDMHLFYVDSLHFKIGELLDSSYGQRNGDNTSDDGANQLQIGQQITWKELLHWWNVPNRASFVQIAP